MTEKYKTVSRILEIKEFTKDRLESEVRNAQQRLNLEQDELDSLESTYFSTSMNFYDKQLSGTMPVREADLYGTYLNHLGKQIEQQRRIIALRAAEYDKIQKSLVDAYMDQRLFEILQNKISYEQIKVTDHRE